MLLEVERQNMNGKMKGMLKQAHLSESLLLAVPLEQIAEKHFPLDEGSKNQRNASLKFHDFVSEKKGFEEVALNHDSNRVFAWFIENRAKDVENLVRRLSRHDVLGHYFLERILDDGDHSKGYVCLLREVVTLPRNVAERIGKGLDQATYHSICSEMVFGSGLSIAPDDLAMPVVEIGSPTIEHILQSFSQLFGRIGVADPVKDVIEGIIEHCISGLEGQAK